jgi:hypothetical protein
MDEAGAGRACGTCGVRADPAGFGVCAAAVHATSSVVHSASHRFGGWRAARQGRDARACAVENASARYRDGGMQDP